MSSDFPEIFGSKKEDDFHTFRSKGLGSSDVPVIMGDSPYKTRRQLWEERVGITINEFKGNYATQRGTELEPVVRDWYNRTYSCRMIPERKIDDKHSFLRANADGVDHNVRKMIEIKCGGLDDHEAGKVPKKYLGQVYFLNYIFGYDIDYVSYNERSEQPYKVVRVKIDPIYQEEIIKKVTEFWWLIQNKIAPDLSDQDVIHMPELEDLIKTYGETKDLFENSKKELEALKKVISGKVTHPKAYCGDFNLRWRNGKTFVITRRR